MSLKYLDSFNTTPKIIHIPKFVIILYGLILGGLVLTCALLTTQFQNLIKDNKELSVQNNLLEKQITSLASTISPTLDFQRKNCEIVDNILESIKDDNYQYFECNEEYLLLNQKLNYLKEILESRNKVLEIILPSFPIKGTRRVITSKYGFRKDPFTKIKQFHDGVDFADLIGTPIVAATDGIVKEAGYNSGTGNTITLTHTFEITTVYMHMSRIFKSKGQKISKKDTIGLLGTTGYSTGPHLHLSMRINGEMVNPLDYLSF